MKLKQTHRLIKHSKPPCPCNFHTRRRKASSNYEKKMIALGYPGGIKNPRTYTKLLTYQKEYHRTHRDKANRVDDKYKARLRELFGAVGYREKNMNSIRLFERNYAKRIASQDTQD